MKGVKCYFEASPAIMAGQPVEPPNVICTESNTPPKINIEPENDGLEDEFPLPGVYSQVPC